MFSFFSLLRTKLDGCRQFEISFLVLFLSYIKVRVSHVLLQIRNQRSFGMANLVKIQPWKLAFCQIGMATLSLSSLSASVSLVLVLTFDVRGDEETLSVSGRRRNKLNVKGCRDSGFLSRSRFEVMLCFDTVKFCMNV